MYFLAALRTYAWKEINELRPVSATSVEKNGPLKKSAPFHAGNGKKALFLTKNRYNKSIVLLHCVSGTKSMQNIV